MGSQMISGFQMNGFQSSIDNEIRIHWIKVLQILVPSSKKINIAFMVSVIGHCNDDPLLTRSNIKKIPKLAGVSCQNRVAFAVEASVHRNDVCFTTLSWLQYGSDNVSCHAAWSDVKENNSMPAYDFMQNVWRIFLLWLLRFLINSLTACFSSIGLSVVFWSEMLCRNVSMSEVNDYTFHVHNLLWAIKTE